jgi:hypothetical protein
MFSVGFNLHHVDQTDQPKKSVELSKVNYLNRDRTISVVCAAGPGPNPGMIAMSYSVRMSFSLVSFFIG